MTDFSHGFFSKVAIVIAAPFAVALGLACNWMVWAIVIVSLLLTGCGEAPRVWNAGGSPSVTVSTTALVNRDYRHRGGDMLRAGTYTQAWMDRERWEIRLPDDTPRNLLVALAYHELGEAADDPGLWMLLQAMATVQFPCGPDSDRTGSARRQAINAAQAEVTRAIAEAR